MTAIVLSAATLVALAATGVGTANADPATGNVPIDSTTKGTITINDADNTATGTGSSTTHHQFKATLVASYKYAQYYDDTLDGLSLDPVANPKVADVEDAVNSVKTSGDPALTTEELANPMDYVAKNWLGYDAAGNSANGDKTSNNSTTLDADSPRLYSGKLRDFVTNLVGKQSFKDAPGVTGTAAEFASGKELPAGLYVIQDVSGSNSTGKTNTIPVLVGTTIKATIGGNAKTFSTFTNKNTLGTVNIKNNQPTIEKTWVGTKKGNNWTTDKSAAIGDTLRFRIKTEVPQTTGFKHYIYKVQDKPTDGLDYVDGSAKIWIGSDAVNFTNGTGVTTSTNDTLSVGSAGDNKDVAFKRYGQSNKDLEFSFWKLLDANGNVGSYGSAGKPYIQNTPITIEYEMKLTEKGAQHNSAMVIYSNNDQKPPKNDNNCDVDNPPTDGACGDHGGNGGGGGGSNGGGGQVDVVNYSMDLHNVFKRDETKDLAGAEFQVFAGDSVANSPLKFENNKHVAATGGQADRNALSLYSYNQTATNADNVTTLKVSDGNPGAGETLGGNDEAKGHLKFDGLPAGDYTVKQTKAATGMVGATLPTFTFRITPATTTTPQAPAKFEMVTADFWGLAHDVGPVSPAQNNTDGKVTVDSVDSISSLPLTGGAGLILLVVLALLFGSVAVGTTVLRKREMMNRSEQEE